MSANPFTLSFGKKPLQYISRLTETNQILESFCAEIPSNQIYMITGVRGSGKTVMMTNIASELRKRRLDRCGTESYQRFTAKSCCKNLQHSRITHAVH